jgi:hypothetical protein
MIFQTARPAWRTERPRKSAKKIEKKTGIRALVHAHHSGAKAGRPTDRDPH